MKGRKPNRWSAEEDDILRDAMRNTGSATWKVIAAAYNKLSSVKRSHKQVRERWVNVLCPAVDKLPWTIEEELVLFESHKELGNRWSAISDKLPGRVENDVKNHFHAMVSRAITRFRRRQRGVEGEIQITKSSAPSHVLRILRNRYARNASQSSISSPFLSIPLPLQSSPAQTLLPSVDQLVAVLDFEKWKAEIGGCSKEEIKEDSARKQPWDVVLSFDSFV